jgi:hypothetical protein
MVAPSRFRTAMARLDRGLGSIAMEVDLPTRPGDVAERHHNRFCREALRRCLQTHHKDRIPQHFTKAAHQKYGYKPRTLKYMKWKARKFHSTTDLVKTGASQRSMVANGTITMSGSAEGGKRALTGSLHLNFVFPGGRGRFRKDSLQQVTIEQMRSEIQAMTADERREVARQMAHEYIQLYAEFRGSRKRVRMPKK